MTEAHHSHPPRNVRTYVRAYVRTYVRTHVRTLGRLRAHAVHAHAYVRTAKEAQGDVEAEDDGSSPFPPATHARTYVRTLYVRTYVFSVRTMPAMMHVRRPPGPCCIFADGSWIVLWVNESGVSPSPGPGLEKKLP